MRWRPERSLRRPLIAFGVLALLAGTISGAFDGSSSAAGSEPSAVTVSAASDGATTVGALFASASATDHSCTASVVDSPKGDVLITAAHCITGTGAGMVFVPGYQDGKEPYGAWQVTGAYGASGWLASGSSREDFAFLTVAPRVIDGQTEQVQNVVGGNSLARTPVAGERVTVTGYNAGSGDSAITCSRTVALTDGYPSFNCDGYVDGTSGSPWLVATAHGEEVVGVIGGLDQGGCTSATSYSAPFNAAVGELYQEAISGASPSTFPSPPSDGCLAIM